MARADAVLLTAVVTLATFVGTEVARRPVRVRHAVQQEAEVVAAGTTDDAADTSDAPGDTHAELAASRFTPNRAEVADRSPADVRELIGAAPGTYMTDMLADLHGSLVRWPDRDQGLRVWVQSLTSVPDWDLRYAQMARDAFADWDVNLPLRFDFVLDSATSDVRITWTNRFAPELGQRVGSTNRRSDRKGWLVEADITVAIHDSTGRTIPPADLAGIVRHEAGHALGLGHSKDPRTMMFPIEMVNDISPADRATLKLLYELPPGAVR